MSRHPGHRWIYDSEELHRRLGEAGFAAVIDVAHSQSTHDALRGIEHRADSQLIGEATKA